MNAKSESARKEWRRRLVIVKQHQLGGLVPDEPVAKPKPARKATAPDKPLSQQEILESARAAVALGVKYLTPAQRGALKEAGE